MITLFPNDIQARKHFEAIKPFIKTRIENILSRGIKRKKRTLRLRAMFQRYLNSLLEGENLAVLITAPAENLQGIIQALERQHPNFFNKRTNENFVLQNIFVKHAYERYFDKLAFIQGINVDTCPYCNRNYIYFLSEKTGIKPQIDHFYPKSKFPILAMSYYNLIPCCPTCNCMEAKAEHDPRKYDLVSPYMVKRENFCFTYEVLNVAVLNRSLDKNSVVIKFEASLDGHLKLFKLEDFYQLHADHVVELISKSKLQYSKRYREQMNADFLGVTFTDHEIDRLILGNYVHESDAHRRPLAKLYQDIGRKLGLI